MRKSSSNKLEGKLLEPTLLFLPLLTFPPFVFYQFFPWYFRVIALLVAIILCFCAQPSLILVFFSAIYFGIIFFRDFSDLNSFWTSCGYYLIIVYGICLYRFFSSIDDGFYRIYFNIYKNIFFVVPAFSIFALIYFELFGRTFFYGLGWDGYTEHSYVYIETPFGLLIPKIFYGFEIQRSFFFFIEPNYLGFFYALNMLVASKLNIKKEKIFIVLNCIGGIITYSYSFFIILFLGLIIKKIYYGKIKAALFLVLIFLLLIYSAIENASWVDRIERAEIFLNNYLGKDILKNIFGFGYYNYSADDAKAISSGFLTSLYEGGFIYLILIFMSIKYMVRKNFILMFIFLMGFSVTELAKFPFFWFAFALISAHRKI